MAQGKRLRDEEIARIERLLYQDLSIKVVHERTGHSPETVGCVKAGLSGKCICYRSSLYCKVHGDKK